MKWLIEKLLKVVGVSGLIRYAWEAAKPSLLEWAESDGKDDWDDGLVKFLDEAVLGIIGELENDGK